MLQRGFTLVELVVTVSLVAILISIGVPSFQNLIRNNRAIAITNDLVLAIQLARSEAVKQQREMTLCRRNAVGDDCENGADWSAGWLICQLNHTKTCEEPVIQVWGPPRGSPVLSGPSPGIEFARTGEPRLSPVTFTLRLLNCTGDEQRTLIVNAAGFVSITRSACP
ncbi:MAG: GspH/FimT family pseudopilin [Chromatiales bacterium]|nr:GspH/FimT family pseudopilin [Chromatiales bacterium]